MGRDIVNHTGHRKAEPEVRRLGNVFPGMAIYYINHNAKWNRYWRINNVDLEILHISSSRINSKRKLLVSIYIAEKEKELNYFMRLSDLFVMKPERHQKHPQKRRGAIFFKFKKKCQYSGYQSQLSQGWVSFTVLQLASFADGDEDVEEGYKELICRCRISTRDFSSLFSFLK